jgi:hypothetical protein
MDKPGYTPGPWIVTDERAMCRELWINVLHPDVGTVSLAAVRPGCDAANELGDTEANARLIAAAPEMFEALKDTLRILDAVRLSAGLGKGQVERMDRARAALSKATGGSHEQG